MPLQTILIAEDETAIADSIAYALRTDGFDHEHVTLGGAVLEAVRRAPERYGLLVLDVGLPDLNGFEVCRQLRKQSDLPIIFLTARSDEIDRIVGLEIGGRRLPYQAVLAARTGGADPRGAAQAGSARSNASHYRTI